MKEAKNPVRGVLFTEKATLLSGKLNQYTFRVVPSANKIQIRRALERVFSKKVLAINTARCSGKKKRNHRTNKFGRKANWKKAIVTLSGVEKLDFAS
ncbi:MAG: 50S ribosomal protein L23 [Candidatus Xiphinematobacter sp.]|nr:MAG: 50S ribosomal protein L23 [Candidatus Xiphinematobacter sp.]QQY08664.1 MAG: 50S ribosomal protein L23 [Candidatus Xiphinematobacter sp.]QQY09399.1 MAG: 50S ribosomal protein L23 [Candidatus Xiphinematobacter sp.]QQY10148.1 MAG: 50S ribosomal protein L23 [Candidatus Xiphinematobacter sp.]QQY10884.1 MAG: 50S ribosomal protein L23 [Candidatus Xiphinematobacter sp.]